MSLLPDTELPWHREARCAEPDVSTHWFHSNDVRETKHAIRVCQGCPVKNQCLEYALTAEDNWGVWGGLTDRQRRSLRRQMLQRAVA